MAFGVLQTLRSNNPTLLAALRHPLTSVRLKALLECNTHQNIAIWEALVDLLSDEDQKIKDAVIKILKRVSHPQVTRLIVALTYQSNKVAKTAIKALSGNSHPEAQRALLRCLTNPIPGLAMQAAQALRGTTQSETLHELCSLITGATAPLSKYAAHALQGVQDEQIVMLLSQVVYLSAEEQDRAHATLALAGSSHPEALAALQKAAQDASIAVRIEAAKSLHGARSEDARIALQHLLKDHSALVRSEAARSLSGNIQADTIIAFEKLLREDSDEKVLLAILTSITTARIRMNSEPILKLAKTSLSPEVRAAALATLPTTLTVVERNSVENIVLHDLSEEVRLAGVLYLEAEQNERALSWLLLRDPSPHLRRNAITRLSGTKSIWCKELILRLVSDSVWRDPSPVVRVAGIQWLTNIRTEEVTSVLHSLARQDPHPEIQVAALNALRIRSASIQNNDLLQILRHPHAAIREAAVSLVPENAAPVLSWVVARLLRQDPSWEVRIQAAKVLGKFRDSSLQQELLKALRDENPLVRNEVAGSLQCRLNTSLAKTLLHWLTTEEPEMIFLVAGILQGISDLEIVSELIALLQHEKSRIREAALIALSKTPHQNVRNAFTLALADKDRSIRLLAQQLLQGPEFSLSGKRKKYLSKKNVAEYHDKGKMVVNYDCTKKNKIPRVTVTST